jgi:hypothetical protein
MNKRTILDEEIGAKGRGGQWPRPLQSGEALIVQGRTRIEGRVAADVDAKRRAYVWSIDAGVNFRWLLVEIGVVWEGDS